MKLIRHLSHLTIVILTLQITGCGGAPDGPQKYNVSGTITFDNKPISKGFITFSPDDSAGNKGPGGGAPIINGKYKTESGKGIVGGPHVVQIVGYDGMAATVEGEQLPDGKALFVPYFTTVNFPKENTVRDFEIPNADAKTN